MIVKEVHSKSILSVSKIQDYVINPYVGCQHGCRYCYARYIKKFTNHKEAWGDFVDVRINAADLLQIEIKKKKRGRVWVSGLCDPYQPLERKYQLTRKCLEILVNNKWPVSVQTRSPLVLRDMDILKGAEDLEVGLTITTADDGIRKLFEPVAPSINERIRALDELHKSGIRTFAMIAPLLPGAEYLPFALEGKVDSILVDRLNYHYADAVFRKYRMEDKLSDEFFQKAGREIIAACRKSGITCNSAY
jgi:DNA repair photolyase